MPPWNIDPDKLDFSQFHPLDHFPASRRCRSLPGGWRNHLKMAWDFKWSRELAYYTRCKLGYHRYGRAWQQSRGDFRACVWCWKDEQ